MTTLKALIVADADIFFDADELGESATYYPALGATVSTVVLIYRGNKLYGNAYGENPGEIATIRVNKATITDPQPHDKISIGSEDWVVSDRIAEDQISFTLGCFKNIRAKVM